MSNWIQNYSYKDVINQLNYYEGKDKLELNKLRIKYVLTLILIHYLAFNEETNYARIGFCILPLERSFRFFQKSFQSVDSFGVLFFWFFIIFNELIHPRDCLLHLPNQCLERLFIKLFRFHVLIYLKAKNLDQLWDWVI